MHTTRAEQWTRLSRLAFPSPWHHRVQRKLAEHFTFFQFIFFLKRGPPTRILALNAICSDSTNGRMLLPRWRVGENFGSRERCNLIENRCWRRSRTGGVLRSWSPPPIIPKSALNAALVTHSVAKVGVICTFVLQTNTRTCWHNASNDAVSYSWRSTATDHTTFFCRRQMPIHVFNCQLELIYLDWSQHHGRNLLWYMEPCGERNVFGAMHHFLNDECLYFSRHTRLIVIAISERKSGRFQKIKLVFLEIDRPIPYKFLLNIYVVNMITFF